ncbi:transglutaminase-like domain-containing protein [uncultured Clostridium sp.]|uniref:transglutaminase-like domain-containing protein n=1 Tax=uncultured Clostridium sp. TaxID=59620 RepID=UPI0025F5F10D|nr:transglutaminase-like domain-containing protein [uncultured Clostridium sp.]MDU4324820.1 transglutaminase-like domain-containing protein [Clostridium celatum]
MNEILSYAMCLFVIVLCIIGSVKITLKRRSVSFSLERVLYYFSILVSILLIALKIDVILESITKIAATSFKLSGIYSDICKIALFVVLFFLIQLVLYKILKVILIPIVLNLNRQNSILLVGLSSVLGIAKGIIFLSIIFIGIISYNNTIGIYNKVNIFNENKMYSALADAFAKNTGELTEEIVENFLPASNIIIYYNGVTLEEGIKSTEEIDSMAKALTENADNDMDKARILYSWVGSNLEYDYDRAEKALNNEKLENSGAISAFNDRSGICFDYSCLYVAMARAVNLKVRLLTGSAYDGTQYGPHAWNEVYISEIEKWIPVDTTFYLAGNYFNNDDFYEDHIIDSIAGEW